MKKYLLSIAILSQTLGAQGKGHSGDGSPGDECTASFYSIAEEVFNDLEKKKIPLPGNLSIDDLIYTYNNITVVPVENMQGCNGSPDFKEFSKTACSYVDRNEIILECNRENKNSWFQVVEKQPRLARELFLHELFWWHKSVPDAKMSYSKKLVDQLPVRWKPNWLSANIRLIDSKSISFSNIGIIFGDYVYGLDKLLVRDLAVDQTQNFCQKLNFSGGNLVRFGTKVFGATSAMYQVKIETSGSLYLDLVDSKTGYPDSIETLICTID